MGARSIKILVPLLAISAGIFTYSRFAARPHIPADPVRRVALIMEASYRMAVPKQSRYDVAALTQRRREVLPMLVDLCGYSPKIVRYGCERFLKAAKHAEFDPPPNFIRRDRIVFLVSDVYWNTAKAFDSKGNLAPNTFTRHGLGGGLEMGALEYWDWLAKSNSRKDPKRFAHEIWTREKVDDVAFRELADSQFEDGWFSFESRR